MSIEIMRISGLNPDNTRTIQIGNKTFDGANSSGLDKHLHLHLGLIRLLGKYQADQIPNEFFQTYDRIPNPEIIVINTVHGIEVHQELETVIILRNSDDLAASLLSMLYSL